MFSSSIAGTPLPDVIEDDFLAAPLSSYSTQKAVCELYQLVFLEYNPRAVVRDRGRSSGLRGRPPLTRAPRAAVDFLIAAAAIDLSPLVGRRALNMPGVSVTAAEQIESLRQVREALEPIPACTNAAITIAGIELAHRIRKRQFSFDRGRRRRAAGRRRTNGKWDSRKSRSAITRGSSQSKYPAMHQNPPTA